jgi:hypothetical protein
MSGAPDREVDFICGDCHTVVYKCPPNAFQAEHRCPEIGVDPGATGGDRTVLVVMPTLGRSMRLDFRGYNALKIALEQGWITQADIDRIARQASEALNKMAIPAQQTLYVYCRRCGKRIERLTGEPDKCACTEGPTRPELEVGHPFELMKLRQLEEKPPPPKYSPPSFTRNGRMKRR